MVTNHIPRLPGTRNRVNTYLPHVDKLPGGFSELSASENSKLGRVRVRLVLAGSGSCVMFWGIFWAPIQCAYLYLSAKIT